MRRYTCDMTTSFPRLSAEKDRFIVAAEGEKRNLGELKRSGADDKQIKAQVCCARRDISASQSTAPQEMVVREKLMSASNMRLRFAAAATELKRIMVGKGSLVSSRVIHPFSQEIEPGMSHTQEYEAAKSVLKRTCQLY